MVFSLEFVNKDLREMVSHWAFDVPIKRCSLISVDLLFAPMLFVPIKNLIFEMSSDSNKMDFEKMDFHTRIGILNAMMTDY